MADIAKCIDFYIYLVYNVFGECDIIMLKKKNDSVINIIRQARKEKFANFIRLPNVILLMTLILIVAIITCVSLLCNINGYQWCSNFLLSISAGFVTGIILYILTNVRNISERMIYKNIKPLEDMDKIGHNLYFKTNYKIQLAFNSIDGKRSSEMDWQELNQEIILDLKSFCELCKKLDYNIYHNIFRKNGYEFSYMEETIRKLETYEVTNKQDFIVFSEEVLKNFRDIIDIVNEEYGNIRWKEMILKNNPV